MKIRLVSAAAALLVCLASREASAAAQLSPVTSASSPVFVTHARDQRLFIVEQAGRIRIFDRPTQTMLSTPFLDIQSLVSSGGERGLLSMAFHPDYATNGYFYVNYTNLAGHTVIARYRVGTNPNVADASSAVTLLTVNQPFANHNGGQLQVGPTNGYLYIGMGDGGGSGDPNCNAQRKDTLLGKMLRLDIRQNLGQAPYYGIPADNPFTAAGDPMGQIPDEVWAFGLRNPWRFSFDRSNGDLYIGDVGQGSYEEIDLQRASTAGGRNFGWKIMEGLHCFSSAACPAGTPSCSGPELTLPIHEYSHATGDCSVTGGYRYRGTRVPELAGRYLFGDYCSGAIRALVETAPGTWQSQSVLSTSGALTTFGEDSDGELYVATGGSIFKLVSDAPTPVPALPVSGVWCLGLCLAVVARARIGSRAPLVQRSRLLTKEVMVSDRFNRDDYTADCFSRWPWPPVTAAHREPVVDRAAPLRRVRAVPAERTLAKPASWSMARAAVVVREAPRRRATLGWQAPPRPTVVIARTCRAMQPQTMRMNDRRTATATVRTRILTTGRRWRTQVLMTGRPRMAATPPTAPVRSSISR